MKKNFNLPTTIFSIFLLWGVILSGKQLSILWPLYTDIHLRAQVQSVTEHFADGKGFLLSSIRIDGIERDVVRVSVREFRKGRDSRTPYSIPLRLP